MFTEIAMFVSYFICFFSGQILRGFSVSLFCWVQYTIALVYGVNFSSFAVAFRRAAHACGLPPSWTSWVISLRNTAVHAGFLDRCFCCRRCRRWRTGDATFLARVDMLLADNARLRSGVPSKRTILLTAVHELRRDMEVQMQQVLGELRTTKSGLNCAPSWRSPFAD